jgi:RNA polymerase sigma-70 factor (ECF subfamily)
VAELDASVVRAAQTGAGWALERIYSQLAPVVHGYLRSQGVDDPEGAVNDVFLRAFGAVAGFEGSPAAFRSWVFTIAHHLVVDRRRFASRRPREAPRDAVAAPAAADDPAHEALARVGAARLHALLDRLTPEQRDVLLLRFVADLSLVEVAAAQGRSVGAVQALQHRALASVRRLLEETSGEPVSRSRPVTLTTT